MLFETRSHNEQVFKNEKEGARFLTDTQKELCARYGAEFMEAQEDSKLGISLNVRNGVLPINGLRHRPTQDTTGWYIWAGEDLPTDSDFFHPLHVSHIDDWCPSVRKYLGLCPGWRFFIASDYEDVWFDESLLDVT